ncbi:MAG: DNA-binding protein [Lachnospiraceae bacterium]|nr:DNA-binding protein [Lachnospiraceae bacterium]
MDELLNKSLLFDFYGELLTGYQKDIYEEFVFDDLSLAELAEKHGITRQAVFNIVKRCERKLVNYEEKLHLVEKFVIIRENAEKIYEISRDDDVRKLAGNIVDIY